MTLNIKTIPCLSDNYAFLLHDEATGITALVDAPEVKPITDALDHYGWKLDKILLTHHHDDHIDGVEELCKKYNCKVYGAKADEHRLPKLDRALEEGSTVDVGSSTGMVMDVSGHTVGHIAFYFPSAHAAFTADSLMALGCGRLFEGTHEQMWSSLSKIAALHPETIVYSGHEYTESNARFAKTIEPDNPDLAKRCIDIEQKRKAGQPTVPSTLSEELATNPFLRANLETVKAAIGMPNASDVECFTEIRKRKDNF